ERLFEKRLLEPSFGHGSFLLPAVGRLLESWIQAGTRDVSVLKDAIVGVELHESSRETTRQSLLNLLANFAINGIEAEGLLDRWLIQGDFLLEKVGREFDYVVGNPPYVRIERIPAALM